MRLFKTIQFINLLLHDLGIFTESDVSQNDVLSVTKHRQLNILAKLPK